MILYGVFAAWVLFDGVTRKTGGEAVGWALGTLLLGPVILPIYLAKRPLKTGESREGGTAWNVLKNFAVLWTIVMAVATFSLLSKLGQFSATLQSDAERAGAGIGMFLSMGLLAVVWFLPTVGAALLGFLLRKNSVVETGPTGSLVGTDSTAGVIIGLAGLVLAAVIGVILIVALSHRGELTSSAASKSGVAGVPPGQPVNKHSWQLSEKTSEMDGTREAVLKLNAESEIRGIIVNCKRRSNNRPRSAA